MKFKRTIAGFAAAAVSLSSLGLSALAPATVSAANPWDGATETSILESGNTNAVSNESSRTTDNSGTPVYNGYLQTTNSPSFDYFKVTYTVEGSVTDETSVFNFQPFDSNWSGWDDNLVTIGDSEYDVATETYSAYVDVNEVKASLSTGGNLKGINLSFAQAEPAVTLTGYYSVKTAADPPSGTVTPDNPLLLYKITEEDLDAAGVNWKGASKATIFVKMTEGGTDSMVNAQIKLGPDGADGQPVGKASSKYLVGKNASTTYNKSGNAIQDNLVGSAGTGIYKFPDVNLNKTMQDTSLTWDSAYENEITITIKAYTDNTNCEFLGIKFNNGAVYPQDFNVPVTEATTYDVVATASKDLLKMTLDYCDSMDSSKYQEDSWNALQTELAKAEAVYKKSGVSDAECKSARASLEKVKSAMLFKDTETASNPLPYRELTNDEIIEEMGVGTNLGNTMDGHSGFTPGETAWQSVVTTKAYIKALHDAGYNTVRIPVTWGTMIDDENGYAINESWMTRVQEIVDYCISQDMYAIINIHHDGAEQSGWLRVAAEDIDSVYEKFECVWRNIAERFKDYDEHLIFESMNEITSMEGDMKNSAEAIAYDTPIIVNLNQIFVNVVRSTGSNNARRWLAVVSHYANGGTQSGFVLSDDSYNDADKIMFALHVYKASTNVTWTYSEVYQVADAVKKCAAKHKVPIILGEYGTRTYKKSGTETGYNDVARAYFSEIVHRACQTAGAVPVVWDQGYGTNGKYETGLFSYWDRADCVPLFKTITDAMMRGTYLPNTDKNNNYDFKDVVQDPEITPITEMTLSDEKVTIELGDNYTVTATTAPSDSNDVVLWSTDDETVVTVSQGKLRARGIGTTIVRAYTQNGEVEKEVAVTVAPDKENAAESIEADDSYTVVSGRSVVITPTVQPAGAETYVTYKSSNTAVASVNAGGRVFGIKPGIAYVTITAAGGVTKTVKINVADTSISNEINLSLHVLYNDASLNYYGCETGSPVNVTGDGQYTVKFNLAEDLSKTGKDAGVTQINNLTAIYIKDADVTAGNAKASSVEAANIRYDSVKINGQELTINETGFNDAMNSNVLDTGGPINAWHDNPIVSGFTSSDHVAKITAVTNPTTVEVTFTLSDVKFAVKANDKTNEVIAVSEKTKPTEGYKEIVIENVGDTAEIKFKAVPTGTDSLFSFSSADSSIVSVDGTALAVDENGYITATVTAMGEGVTTVTARAENGVTAEFKIAVGAANATPVGGNNESEPGNESSESEQPSDSTPSDSDGSSDSVTDSSDESQTDSSDGSASETDSTPTNGGDNNPGTGAGTFAVTGILISAAALVVLKKRK